MGISVTDNYDALLSTTLRNFSRKLRDNIFNAMPMLKWLRGKGKVRMLNGGYQIVEHVLYGKNTTVAAYSGYDDLDTTPQEGITVAMYAWKEYGGTIAISRAEQRKNSGEAQLINLLQAKIQQAELSIQDVITTDIFADYAAAATDATPGKKITGLNLIIGQTPASSTVGGISGATYAWWRNYKQAVGSYTSNLEDYLRTGYNSTSAGGGDFVDLILCSQTAFQYYESLGTTLKRFNNEAATLDLGFPVLKYKGADMFWDAGISTNVPATGETIYLINSKNLTLCVDSQSDFVTTDFIENQSQTAKVAKVLAMLNLTTNNRRKLGVLTGITT